MEMAQARKGLDAAAAADRILEALLSIKDGEERLAMVPEAFVPPQEAEAQVNLCVLPFALRSMFPVCIRRDRSRVVQQLEGSDLVSCWLIHSLG